MEDLYIMKKQVEFLSIDDKCYFVSKLDDNCHEDDLFIFNIDNKLTEAYFDDLLGSGIKWVKKVIVEPKQIGWLFNEGPPHDRNQDYRGKFIEPVRIPKEQFENGKIYEIEMIDEFSNPEEFKDEGLFDSKAKPKLIEGKVIIYKI